MARQLKFRVWDKYQSQFLSNFSLSGGGDFPLIVAGTDRHDNFVIQQFTGVKDGKGRDIYEGDIIKYTNYTSKAYGHESISVVEWSEHGLGFSSMSLMTPTHIEILGNIFENPKLLEKIK